MTSEPSSRFTDAELAATNDIVRRASLSWAAAALLIEDEDAAAAMAAEAVDGISPALMVINLVTTAVRTLKAAGVDHVELGTPQAAQLGSAIVQGARIYTELDADAEQLMCRIAAMTVEALCGRKIAKDAQLLAANPHYAAVLDTELGNMVAPFLLTVAEMSGGDGLVDPLDKAAVGLTEIRAVNFARIQCARMRVAAESSRAA